MQDKRGSSPENRELDNRVPETQFSWREAAIDIAAGTCAGISQVAIGHPLDTIKVRMQASGQVMRNADAKSLSTMNTFRSPWHVVQRTLRFEGVQGLYKGAASPATGAMLQNASGFLFWGLSKKLFADDIDKTSGELSVAGLFKAGLVCGMLCLVVENPVDLVKTQMQVQLGSNQANHMYRSVFHAGGTIVKTRGISGLYQAVFANSLRFVPGRSVYMASFETSFRWLKPQTLQIETHSQPAPSRKSYYGACFASGCIAGGAAWSLFYPFDVIRNVMMGDHIDPKKRRYRGFWHCTQSLVESGGFSSLWRGFVPCMLRGVPVNGCIFCEYTAVKEELGKPQIL